MVLADNPVSGLLPTIPLSLDKRALPSTNSAFLSKHPFSNIEIKYQFIVIFLALKHNTSNDFAKLLPVWRLVVVGGGASMVLTFLLPSTVCVITVRADF